jgi:hypothetical protein
MRPSVEVLPIPMVVKCPKEGCGKIHIDEGEWATKRHMTHLCAACGHEWKPYSFPTVGVASSPPYSPGREIDKWRAAKFSIFSDMDWCSIDQKAHDAVYQYLLRELCRGRVPSLRLVIDTFKGVRKVPPCGYINCFMEETFDHVH